MLWTPKGHIRFFQKRKARGNNLIKNLTPINITYIVIDK